MSLSPAFLDELRNRVSLSSVAAPHVTWDMRKSNMAKGDWWAPCPFHQEKSASFHVDDRKGFYYCFGCHAKGDLFRFLQERDGKTFIEAVETIAQIAGIPVPQRERTGTPKPDDAAHLFPLLEAALLFYRDKLATANGSTARDYLAGRGIAEEAQRRWDLGYAPHTSTLVDHFVSKGVPLNRLVEAGLAIAEAGKPARDRFRDRLMIPIRDHRGRVVSFGGRTLPGSASAKYINGPQTAIFDKGRTLFNYSAARSAAAHGHPVVVAEGYLDVISMVEAGYAATVAPLGTAVTPAQITALLKITDEPVFALDGDPAGLRSAHRVIDTSLPLLTAGKGIRFAMLPDGRDPDDLIRSGNTDVLQALILQSLPMIDLLWAREIDGPAVDSPERLAALERRLANATDKITDPAIRSHYTDALNARLSGVKNSLTSIARQRRPTPLRPTPAASTNAEDLILSLLIQVPALRQTFVGDLERLATSNPRNHALRDMLLLSVRNEELAETPEFAAAIADIRTDHSLLTEVTRLREAPEPARHFALAEAFFRLQASRSPSN